jgi:phenylalanyl-tRNA synthetase beta chain
MKFSLSWLRTHLETQAPLAQIAETLSAIGLEVEGIEDHAAPLAPFRTARIIEAVQHPNADRLRVCRVDAGSGEEVTVVCGAPNARTGLHAVFAPPGAVIPATGLVLKTGEIRGVASAGMLVSIREMGLGDEHDGIVELPDGAPVGVPYAAWAGLDDPTIEIAVTPNRGDALAVRGVARDLAAAGLGTLKPWHCEPVQGTFESSIAWDNQAPEDCPWVLGRIIRTVRNGPSPAWLRQRLASIGLRPINALVDVTNFFAIDLGRPLHVFDADRVAGATLTLRHGREETFRALNGRDVTAGSQDLVIADEAGVQSLAGIMGGEATSCTEATTSVFLECALFDPVRIARSGRAHALPSDARQRFERGVDPALPSAALDAASRMILDLCGGEASQIVAAGAEPAWRRQASLRFERLAGFGGAAIAEDEASAILQRLGFAITLREPSRITVAVPSWRNDIAGGGPADQHPALDPALAATASAGAAAMEPECDLIEEVLRIHGLDRIAPVSLSPASVVPAPSLSPRQARAALARRILAASGLAECVTYSFVPRAVAAVFGPASPSLTLNNPIAADLDQMRPTPLAGLALAAQGNQSRGAGEIALFEAGPAYTPEGQALIAAAWRSGSPPRHFRGPVRPVDALDLKGEALALLAALGAPMDALGVTADAASFYHPGQSGVIRQGPRIALAQFGMMHPAALQALGLQDAPCGAFEVFLDAIPDPKRRRRGPADLPAFQPLHRDFAFITKIDTAAATVLRAARSADRSLVASVSLFDVFEGATLPPGHKSLGVEVVFQPRDRTWTDREIEALCAKVVDAVFKASGAQLR